MPATQVVLGSSRSRSLRSRILGGPSRTAAITTLAVVAACLASASTTAAHADGSTGGAGGSVTITFTVPPFGAGPGSTGPPGSTGDFTVTVQPGAVTLQDIGESGFATGGS